jgi:probable rRNA maturation factor
MIQFSSKSTQYSIIKKAEIKKWIIAIILGEGKKVGEISYIFCNDESLLELNEQYLKHHTLTDIITFDYCEKQIVSGDIFISIERVTENAEMYSKSFNEELGRVMAHGILHLLGYSDKSLEAKNKMTEMENKYLVGFPLL